MSPVGTEIISRETPPPRSAPTDTGVWFVCGLAERGPQEPVLITSMSRFEEIFGDRLSYSATLYDSVETFFREGGARCYVSRVVGPSADEADVVLNDGAGTPAATLRVEANGHGDWGNALNVAVTAGVESGTFVLAITHDTLGALETSPELADKAAALQWARDGSDYINLVDLGTSTLDPAPVAATGLTGGTDDRGSITDDEWQDALDLFTKDLGPGQVSFPGRTTATAQTALLNHAASNNRVALLDMADTAAKATLTAAAATLRSLANARFGAAFAPWAIIPGILPGSTRTVPYSAVQAGLIARLDGLGETPNVPAAGRNGQARYAIDLSQAAWSDDDRDDLNEAGVNVARILYGGVRTYGYRTLVNPVTNSNWINFGNARLYMGIAALGDVIAEDYVLAQIDGRGRKIAQFQGELIGMLVPFFESGSLYGETPEEAFNVDTGAQVNTPESIANGELRAVIALRMSPFAEWVTLELVKTRITEAVA